MQEVSIKVYKKAAKDAIKKKAKSFYRKHPEKEWADISITVRRLQRIISALSLPRKKRGYNIDKNRAITWLNSADANLITESIGIPFEGFTKICTPLMRDLSAE